MENTAINSHAPAENATFRTAITTATAALRDGTEQMRIRARQAAESTDGYVRANPWQVVGIAALIGLAVGILSSHRANH